MDGRPNAVAVRRVSMAAVVVVPSPLRLSTPGFTPLNADDTVALSAVYETAALLPVIPPKTKITAAARILPWGADP